MTTWAVAVVPDGADDGWTGAAAAGAAGAAGAAAANDCVVAVADEDDVRGGSSAVHSLLSM